MSEDPRVTDGPVKQFGASMPAALYLALSPDEIFNGSLPVNIPTMGADYRYTDAVVYPRGFGLSGSSACPTDVPDERWSSAYVTAALERGIMSMRNGIFAPEAAATYADASLAIRVLTGRTVGNCTDEASITRGELAVLLYEAAKADGKGFAGMWAFPLNYVDASDIPEEQYEALCWLTMKCVLGGYDDGRLAPGEMLTREQLAAIMIRYSEAQERE